MSRQLTDQSNLDALKKEAKRWLAALRAGDAEARTRLLAATPAAPETPGLRDVQLALARELGLPGWADLKAALEARALAKRTRAEIADQLLRSGVFMGDPAVAARLYAHRPDVADHDLYTAVAAGRIERVRAILAKDPGAASRKGGPRDLEPLLYLAAMRLPGGGDHAVEIGTLLLDHGADPNARWSDGWDNPFTAITLAIGEGEGVQPPHPQADALVALLLERGADPFDTQTFYDTSITRDETKWLDVLWAASEARGETDRWRTSPAFRIGGRIPQSPLDFMLGLAVSHRHRRRVAWLIAHGAHADGVNAYSGRPLREEALVYGDVAIAELLVQHGATVKPLNDLAAFQAACMRLDGAAAREIAARAPDVLRHAESLHTAARQGRADVVALLLDLGMAVDVMDRGEMRALQAAVAGGSLDVVKLLVERGAEIDRPTVHYGGAMGFAGHFVRREIAEFLAPLSRDVWNLTFLGMKERLDELLAAEPERVNAVNPRGVGATPLFALPDDEEAAADMAAFLLARGADPAIRNRDGLSPEESARKRGLYDAADIIASASET